MQQGTCTSCAHQAQLGWISRHSSQDVALPLIHMLRPEKSWEKDHRDTDGYSTETEKQSQMDFNKDLNLGTRKTETCVHGNTIQHCLSEYYHFSFCWQCV